MSDLQGRNVLLGVSGSVAAFKSAALASELTKTGATVRVVLTEAGERFVTAETFRDLTEQPVATSLWDAEMDHIDLARWAEVMVVAPATANVIARFALGLADDLLSTILLAVEGPVLVAPAMETHMWSHSATVRNVQLLRERGVIFVGPRSGRLASGALGAGRMAEPSEIVTALESMLPGSPDRPQPLKGVRVVVTAGPTHEPIDPVRFLSNRSSGRMGYALALAAAQSGASVHLISGPVEGALRDSLPSNISVADVTTAEEMKVQVLAAAAGARVLIMAAAVADFTPASVEDHKIKKEAGLTSIQLRPADDILTILAAQSPHVIRIGFAAETTDLLAHAEEKLRKKNLAMIVANDVGGKSGEVFGSDSNQVTILVPDQEPLRLDRMSKLSVAERIISMLPDLLTKPTAT